MDVLVVEDLAHVPLGRGGVLELLLDLGDLVAEVVLVDVDQRLQVDVGDAGKAFDVGSPLATDADDRDVDAIVGAENLARRVPERRAQGRDPSALDQVTPARFAAGYAHHRSKVGLGKLGAG